MKIINPSGYREIYWGLLSGAVLLCAFLVISVLPLGEKPSLLMALAVLLRASELLANIFVINGLIESGRDSVPMNRAKSWMAIRLVINAVFYRAGRGLFPSVSSDVAFIDYLIGAFEYFGFIAGMLAYSYILTGFSQVWDMCGGEKEARKMVRLRRSLVASTLLCLLWVLILIMSYYFDMFNPFLLIIIAVLLIWRGAAQLMCISASRKTASILTEISK